VLLELALAPELEREQVQVLALVLEREQVLVQALVLVLEPGLVLALVPGRHSRQLSIRSPMPLPSLTLVSFFSSFFPP